MSSDPCQLFNKLTTNYNALFLGTELITNHSLFLRIHANFLIFHKPMMRPEREPMTALQMNQ